MPSGLEFVASRGGVVVSRVPFAHVLHRSVTMLLLPLLVPKGRVDALVEAQRGQSEVIQ